jgi:quercetin dioxygenase-like cupin family protein
MEASQILLVDNVFVKMMHMPKSGDIINGHAHTFDHITLLSSGSVLMEHDNGNNTFKAPQLIVTPKGITHKFTALEDNVLICCVHAIRDGDDVDDVAPQNINPSHAKALIAQFPLTQQK